MEILAEFSFISKSEQYHTKEKKNVQALCMCYYQAKLRIP